MFYPLGKLQHDHLVQNIDVLKIALSHFPRHFVNIEGPGLRITNSVIELPFYNSNKFQFCQYI